MSRVRIIARGIRRSHDERAVPPNRAAGERRATQSGHGSSCHTLLTPTEPQRLPRFVRLSHVRVYAYAHARTYVPRTYVWGSHHLPRRGMSGRTECGEPSVTIAHRGIFTPTLALSRNPSIPILHTSRRLITVTLPAYFLLRQCRGFPERLCAILLDVVYFLLLGKSLGRCERNAGPFARRLSRSSQILRLLRSLRSITRHTSMNLR